MRLPWRRAVQAAEAPPVPRARKELGASGTLNLQGFLQQHEYLAELTGTDGIKVYTRMRRSDASVREALWHIFGPILNATADIEFPFEDPTPEELEATEAVRQAYFEWPLQPFQEYLGQVLLYLAYGHQVFEIVWQVIEKELVFEDPTQEPEREEPEIKDEELPNKSIQRKQLKAGKETPAKRTIPRRQFLTWRRFAQRLPETITRWNVEEGELVSIEQQAMKGEEFITVTIPAEQLVLYVNEREGDDFTGIPLLRSSFKAFVMKELIEKISGVALERHGVGIPIAYVPESRANDEQTINRIEEILESIRAGEFSYIVMPGPKAQVGAQQEGYTVEILSPSGEWPDFTKILEYWRGEIAGSVLARFSQLGHGSVGARATGDVQSIVWFAAIHAVAQHISDTNATVIERFVNANYENIERYPRLVFRDIETRSLAEYAHAISELVSSGALEPDISARRSIREDADLPPEDDPEGVEDRRTAPPPMEPFEEETQPGDDGGE